MDVNLRRCLGLGLKALLTTCDARLRQQQLLGIYYFMEMRPVYMLVQAQDIEICASYDFFNTHFYCKRGGKRVELQDESAVTDLLKILKHYYYFDRFDVVVPPEQ